MTPLSATLAATPPPAVSPLVGNGSTHTGDRRAVAADAPSPASVDNFRDVAGTGAGYLAGPTRVNKAVFYRSNAFTPNDTDLATLAGLNMSTVYDLRSDHEESSRHDVLPEGVTYTRIPILSGNIATLLDGVTSTDDARRFMQDMNRGFVTGQAERVGFGQLLTAMATTDGPQAFHCTAGKDRTGWTAFLLLSIAGVAPKTIMDDYLLTNHYAKESVAANMAAMHRLYGDAATDMAPLTIVEKSYLQAGIDQLVADHGTVDGYLTEGLGLSADTVDSLRAKLLD